MILDETWRAEIVADAAFAAYTDIGGKKKIKKIKFKKRNAGRKRGRGGNLDVTRLILFKNKYLTFNTVYDTI